VFAPGAQPFFRLELRHAEQMAEYLEPMPLRQLDQFGNGLGNEGHGLVGAALLTSFCSLYGWRFRRFARSLPLPTARTFGQKFSSQHHKISLRNTPFGDATLGRIS
jgi:hypothetical protein